MADIYRTFPPLSGGNAQWGFNNPAGTVLRQGFFGDPPAPSGIVSGAGTSAGSATASAVGEAVTSGGGSNPTTIMGAAAIWYADAAQPGLAPNADGSGTLSDGGPVRFLPGLAGPNAATTDNAREAIYRAGGGDPYIEGDAGSQLRANLSRAAGVFYAIIRVQFRGTGTQFDQPFTVATDTATFYNGTAWGNVKLNPFLSPVDARFEVGTGTEPASQDAPRNTWHTIEVYGTATLNGLAVNGATFVTASRSAVFPATAYIDLFNSVDGGSVSPGVPTWFRRGAVLNAIPDATQRAALLTWATDGDPGGGGTIASGAGTAAGTATASAAGASTRAASGTSAGAATVAATGRAIISAAGTSAGTATASAVGATAGTINSGAGSAAGSATVAAVGASTRAASGSAAGAATVAASGASTAASSGASAGIATAAATGRATAQATGSAAGVGAANGTGAAVVAATGSAAGVATVSGVSPGGSINSGAGSAAGAATAQATGVTIRTGAGSSAGVATVTAIGASIRAAAGASAGVATVSAIGRATFAAIGAAAGIAAANATGRPIVAATGAAGGTGAASGTGSATAAAVGAAAGLATAQAVGVAVIPDAFTPQFTVEGFWLQATVQGSFGAQTVPGQWPVTQVDGQFGQTTVQGVWPDFEIDGNWRVGWTARRSRYWSRSHRRARSHRWSAERRLPLPKALMAWSWRRIPAPSPGQTPSRCSSGLMISMRAFMASRCG